MTAEQHEMAIHSLESVLERLKGRCPKDKVFSDAFTSAKLLGTAQVSILVEIEATHD